MNRHFKMILMLMFATCLTISIIGCKDKSSEESMKEELESLKSEMSNYTFTSETTNEDNTTPSKGNDSKGESYNDKNIWFGKIDEITDKLNAAGYGCNLVQNEIELIDDNDDHLVFNYTLLDADALNSMNELYSYSDQEYRHYDNVIDAYFSLLQNDYNSGLFQGEMYVCNNKENGYISFDGECSSSDYLSDHYFFNDGDYYGGVYICGNRMLQIYYMGYQSLSGKYVTRDDFVDEILDSLDLPKP